MSAVDEEEFHEFRGATDGHVTEFFGLPVHEYTAESELVADGTEAVRVGVDWDAEVPFVRTIRVARRRPDGGDNHRRW